MTVAGDHPGLFSVSADNLEFLSGSDRVRADLYRPAGVERPPVVVMGHGFAANRNFGLVPFAQYFAAHGMATLLFDYRGFGDSEGLPRGWVAPSRHIEDFAAAVRYVRSRSDLDGTRLALWGTSFGGGHALVTAARDKNISAVVAQVPHVDGFASALRYPLRLVPQAAWLGVRDLAAAMFGAPRVRVPVVARQGVCCLAGEDCYAGYHLLVPPDARAESLVPAAILLTIGSYRPIREVENIKAPTLIVAARHDSLIPLSAILKTVRRIRDVRFELFDGGHFDPYVQPLFERNVALQNEFLMSHLLRQQHC